jgi:hypothetical protein
MRNGRPGSGLQRGHQSLTSGPQQSAAGLAGAQPHPWQMLGSQQQQQQQRQPASLSFCSGSAPPAGGLGPQGFNTLQLPGQPGLQQHAQFQQGQQQQMSAPHFPLQNPHWPSPMPTPFSNTHAQQQLPPMAHGQGGGGQGGQEGGGGQGGLPAQPIVPQSSRSRSALNPQLLLTAITEEGSMNGASQVDPHSLPHSSVNLHHSVTGE